MPCLSLLLLLLLGDSGRSQEEEGPLVQVAQGLLRAEVRALKDSDKQMLYCAGIPYAEPPLGPLRFKDAVAAAAWAGERACRAECPVCAQPLAPGRTTMVRGSEDCLCLNVYAPHPPPPAPLPVMVWVHGGAFAIGDGGQMLYGPDFLVAEGVVVVTLNYRLGALGFLNLGSEEAPGNQGLKDQVLALRWVRDNVAAFGGDPGRVTVFGESAGGGSVHLLTLSPMASGLFHGAIMQSGSAANPWAFKGDARNNTRLLLEAAGCDPALGDAPDPRAALDCLRAAPARALAAPTDAFQSPEERSVLSTLAFAPSLDWGARFLPAEPCALLQQGRGAAVPTLAGYNSADGIVMLPLVRRPGALEAFDAALGEGRGVCQPCEPCPPSAARRAQWGAALRERFLAGRPLTNDQAALQGFVRLQTLLSFALGTVQSALGRANASAAAAAAAAPAPPHFLYEFAVDTGTNFFKSLFGGKGFNGSAHADELLYLFHNRLGSAAAPGSVEDLTRRRLVALWTAFAKTGNPTPQTSELLPTAWQPFTAEHEHFYHIGNGGAELRQRPLREDRAFFEGLWATADA